MVPHAALPDPTTKPRTTVTPGEPGSVPRRSRGRPLCTSQGSPQGPPQLADATPQNAFDHKLAMLRASPSRLKEEEEQAGLSQQPTDESGADTAAAVARHVAQTLPSHPSSSSQAQPAAVSVSVSVQDDPVSALLARPTHTSYRPTLLPRSPSPPTARTSSPLVSALLGALASGQGQGALGQHARQGSPVLPRAAESQSEHQSVPDHPAWPMREAELSAAQAADAAEPSDQHFSLDTAMARHFSQNSSPEIGSDSYRHISTHSHPVKDPSQQPSSLRAAVQSDPCPEAKPGSSSDDPQSSAAVHVASAASGKGQLPASSLCRGDASSVADQLISESFDKLGQGTPSGTRDHDNHKAQLEPPLASHEQRASAMSTADDRSEEQKSLHEDHAADMHTGKRMHLPLQSLTALLCLGTHR